MHENLIDLPAKARARVTARLNARHTEASRNVDTSLWPFEAHLQVDR